MIVVYVILVVVSDPTVIVVIVVIVILIIVIVVVLILYSIMFVAIAEVSAIAVFHIIFVFFRPRPFGSNESITS